MNAGNANPFGPVGVMRSWLRFGRNDNAGQKRSGASRLVSWVIFIVIFVYFLVPLFATFLHSIKPRPNGSPIRPSRIGRCCHRRTSSSGWAIRSPWE